MLQGILKGFEILNFSQIPSGLLAGTKVPKWKHFSSK